MKMVFNSSLKAGREDRTAVNKSVSRKKRGLKAILVPVDFSPDSRKALRYALTLAAQLGGRIQLLHVIEPVPYGMTFEQIPIAFTTGEMEKAARTRLKKLVEEEAIAPEFLKGISVRVGPPHHEIIDEAIQRRSDMIVIATHGYNAFTRTIFGSTAERVVRHAKCPVLVVRENERDFA